MEFEGQTRIWRSGVQIKKCRYLEQSGCVGMCINMCKVWLPNQSEQCYLLVRCEVCPPCACICVLDGKHFKPFVVIQSKKCTL